MKIASPPYWIKQTLASVRFNDYLLVAAGRAVDELKRKLESPKAKGVVQNPLRHLVLETRDYAFMQHLGVD